MTGALVAFLRERFHPLATLPLAVALAAAPLARRGGDLIALARVAAFAWLALLLLRIADDLADLDLDRAFHGERGLSRGEIDPAALRRAVAAGIPFLLLLAWGAAPWVVGGAAYYAAYYRLREALPPWARALAVNAAFALLPLFAAGPRPDPPAVLLAAFVYVAAVGHEWSHDVHSASERPAGFPSLANAYGARRAAALGALHFSAAALLGAAFWALAGRPAAFGVALIAGSVGLALPLARLVAAPDAHRARPIYVAGAAFWALPALALLAG